MNVGDVYDACLNGGPSSGDGRSCADGGREGEFQLRVVVPGSDERVSSINAKDSGRIAEAEKKLLGLKGKDAESIFKPEIIEAFANLYVLDLTSFAKHKAATLYQLVSF